MKHTFKTISEETGKINIVPTYENLLISYVRLYSSMDSMGKKMIEEEMSKIGLELDRWGKLMIKTEKILNLKCQKLRSKQKWKEKMKHTVLS
jgi:hypothetical protein